MYLPLLFSILAFVISLFSFFYFRSYLKRRTGHERILSELRAEVEIILRSIDETTDRDISLIEDREIKLKALLDETEKRLKVYIREMEKHYSPQDAPALPAKSISYQEIGKNRYRAAQTVPGQTEAAAAGAAPAGNSAKQSPAFPLPSFSVKQPDSAGEKVPGKTEQINELFLAGFTAPVIASRLGLSISEVEFALALQERRANS